MTSSSIDAAAWLPCRPTAEASTEEGSSNTFTLAIFIQQSRGLSEVDSVVLSSTNSANKLSVAGKEVKISQLGTKLAYGEITLTKDNWTTGRIWLGISFHGKELVSVDAHLPNGLLEASLRRVFVMPRGDMGKMHLSTVYNSAVVGLLSTKLPKSIEAHADLLACFETPPASDISLEGLVAFGQTVSPGDTLQILMLWAATGQLVAYLKSIEDSVGLKRLLTTNLPKLPVMDRKALASMLELQDLQILVFHARAALRLAYELDTQALVPSFFALHLAPLLALVGALPSKASAIRLEPPVAPALPEPETNPAAANLVATARPGLDRSKTLMERDADWERAAQRAARTLNRHFSANKLITSHRTWAEEWLIDCHQALSAFPRGVMDRALEALNASRQDAKLALQSVTENMVRAENEGLEKRILELAAAGGQMRTRIHQLVHRFGKQIGNFEDIRVDDIKDIDKWLAASCVSTGAGFHEGQKMGTVDGKPLRPDGKPLHELQAPQGVCQVSPTVWMFTQSASNSLRMLDTSTEEITTIVGSAGLGYRDGQAKWAQLRNPSGVMALRGGSVLIADSGNALLRILSPVKEETSTASASASGSAAAAAAAAAASSTHPNTSFNLSTWSGTAQGHKDGPLHASGFSEPRAFCRAGDSLIVADGCTLREILEFPWDLPGDELPKTLRVRTICGHPGRAVLVDGPVASAGLVSPAGIAAFPGDKNYVLFTDRHVIRMVNLKSGKVITIAGTLGKPGGFKDGKGLEAQFHSPQGICFLQPPAGRAEDFPPTLIVADTKNNCLRAVIFYKGAPIPTVSAVMTVSGRAGKAAWRDGEAGYAQFNGPAGVALGTRAGDTKGEIMITELTGHRLRWFWSPELRVRARREYEKLREPGSRLAQEMSNLAKECDIGDHLSKALATAQAKVLEARVAACARVYETRVRERVATLKVADDDSDVETSLRVMCALAPDTARLSSALEILQSEAPEVHLKFMPVIQDAVVNRLLAVSRKEEGTGAQPLPTPGAARVTAAQAAQAAQRARAEISQAQAWLLMEEDLPGWVKFVTTHPQAFSPGAFQSLCKVYRGAPCKELLWLATKALEPLGVMSDPSAVTVDSLVELISDWGPAIAATMTSSVYSGFGENERMTPEKLVRSSLQQWSAFALGYASTSMERRVSLALLQCGLTQICSERGPTGALLSGISRGLTVFLAKMHPSTGAWMSARVDDDVYDIVLTVATKMSEALAPKDRLDPLLRRWDMGNDDSDEEDEPQDKKDKKDKEKTQVAKHPQETWEDVALLHAAVESLLPTLPDGGEEFSAWLSELKVWVKFVLWAADEAPRALLREAVESFAPLKAVAQQITGAFQGITTSFEEGSCTIELFTATESALPDLLPGLKRVNLEKRFREALRQRQAELKELQADLEAVAEATENFFSEMEPAMMRVTLTQTNWNLFKISHLRAFFGNTSAEEAHPNLAPLPKLLMTATPWLQAHANSKTFALLWSKVACDLSVPLEERLQQAASEWGNLAVRMLDGTIRFGEFQGYAQHLKQEDESAFFIRSANMAKKPDFAFAKPPVRVSRVETEGCQAVIKQFALLELAYNRSTDMQDAAMRLAKLVKQGSPTIQETLTSNELLCGTVKTIEDWDSTPVAELPKYAEVAQRVDQRLFDLNPDFLDALKKYDNILSWLAEAFPPPDTNFTSAIEMALGKPEMECPPELWVEGTHGRPGHPDEQRLSLLTSVRTGLHPYLYRTDGADFGPFDTMKDALDCLSSLVGDINVLTGSLAECGELFLAFAEILSDETAGSGAVGRLLNLERPEWKAQWQFKVTTTNVELRLSYEVPTKSGQLKASQSLAEVLDFQSSVVLAKNHGEALEAVDRFVASFGWAKELARAYQELVSVGHFGYLAHESSISILSDPDILKKEADNLKKEAKIWSNCVDRLRGDYAAINWFAMRQLQQLLHFLPKYQEGSGHTEECKENDKDQGEEEENTEGGKQNGKKDGTEDAQAAKLQEHPPRTKIASLFEGIFQTRKECLDVADQFLKALCSAEETPLALDIENDGGLSPANISGSAFKELRILAKALAKTLPCEVRWRPLATATAAAAAAAAAGAGAKASAGLPSKLEAVSAAGVAMFDGGLSVAVGPNPLELAISAFAQVGALPEWPLMLCCRRTTTFEEVRILLHRWTTLEARQGLFCLCGIDALSPDVSHELASLLMSRAGLRSSSTVAKRSTPATLLLVSQSDEHHLIRQLESFRITIAPMSRRELVSIGQCLDARYSKGAVVLTSAIPGSGKSFVARSKACREEARYLHLPLHNAVGISEVFERHGSALTSEGNVLIHIDIVSGSMIEGGDSRWMGSRTQRLDALLVELLMLGGLFDPAVGLRFAWEADHTTLCIEVATLDLVASLSVLTMLPNLQVQTTADNFCALPDELKVALAPSDLVTREVAGGSAGSGAAGPSSSASALASASASASASSSTAPTSASASASPAAEGAVVAASTSAAAANTVGTALVGVDRWKLPTLQGKVKATLSQFPTGSSIPTKERMDQVQVVCRLLQAVKKSNGRWLHDVRPDRFAIPVPGSECFKLLEEAIFLHLRGREASAAVLYAFASVVYWQLHGFLSMPDNLLHLVGLHSAAGDRDVRVIAARGEVFAFFCRTAADFTCRQERPAPAERIGEWLRLTHSQFKWPEEQQGRGDTTGVGSRQPLGCNTEWLQRTAFISAGQPVYRMGTWLDPTYVHFRAEKGCWVEEGNVVQIGPVGRSSATPNLLDKWVEQLDHGARTVEVTVAHLFSHEEAVKLSEQLVHQDEQRLMAAGAPGELATWDETNHEVLLIGRNGDLNPVLNFLARDIKLLKRRLHPDMVALLESHNIHVGDEIHRANAKHHEYLSRLTGVTRDATEALKLLKGGFCLTGDGLLKLIAIYIRASCGVPVILQGECGAGKTHMLRYLCAWLQAELCVLDIHGGTTEEDIEGIFRQANTIVEEKKAAQVFVFLDEVNTCAHMDLICEAICHRSLHGKIVNKKIKILAAANPHRRRTKELDAQGLTYKAPENAAREADPLRDLVYRVHPIPASLREFLFDFGGLPPDTELQYIKSMAASQYPTTSLAVRATISRMMQKAMSFVREAEGDHSAVSLRDIHRAMRLAIWFQKFGASKIDPGNARHPLSAPIALGLAHVFYFRLPSSALRSDLMRLLRLEVMATDKETDPGFEWLQPVGVMEKIVMSTMKGLCSKLTVEEGVAMNAALMENLYVTLVCICNRVPCFVVGKPGSSKTLMMQVLVSNLQGEQSPNPFWRKFPALYVFSYQCSPLSTAVGIKHQYEIACNYQRKAQRTKAVLLLDEVGLAEHSPDMPLKVLHGILVNPEVAVVGLSNWTLDAAKMNRAILLQRPSPTPADIHLTGVHLLTEQQEKKAASAAAPEAAPAGLVPPKPALVRSRSGASSIEPWLEPLSRAYHEVYTRQKGRDFLGMRDYYQMVQFLWRELLAPKHRSDYRRTFNKSLLARALCRNFSGREDLLHGVLEVFGLECFKEPLSSTLRPSLSSLVSESIADLNARHLMLLTTMGAAVPLLFSRGILTPETSVLVGSDFPDDSHDLYLIQHVNRIKAAMASGETIVMWNLDRIYESLYDVLNQRYVVRTSGGRTRRSLRLAIGARSQLCPVEEGFRLIVVVEKDHALNNLDLPLLNRFEKFQMNPQDLLDPAQVDGAAQLDEWMSVVAEESGFGIAAKAFCGVHADTAASLLLTAVKKEAPALPPTGTQEVEVMEQAEDVTEGAARVADSFKRRLAGLATPFALLRSPKLRSATDEAYRNSLANLTRLVETLELPQTPTSPEDLGLLLVMTKTPLLVMDGPWTSMRLSEMSSEARLDSIFRDFYSTSSNTGGAAEPATASTKTLMIHCDPHMNPQAMIDHARLLAERRARLYKVAHAEGFQRRCFFIVHMPPSHRVRQYGINFQPGWSFFFVDEMREDQQRSILAGVSTEEVLQKSLHELCQQGSLKISEIVRKRLHSALATIAIPGARAINERTSFLLMALADGSPMQKIVEVMVTEGLENLSRIQSGPLQVPYHVELALGQLAAGSLRTSLEVAIDALVLRALSHALMMLDVNSSLDFFQQAVRHSPEEIAWLALAARLLDRGGMASCRFDNLLAASRQSTKNTGLYGHLQAQFPFSYRLQSQLAALDVEASISGKDVDPSKMSGAWQAWCKAHLGEATWTAADRLKDPLTQWHLGYLHDVVHSGLAPRIVNVSAAEQLRLHTLILGRRCPEALQSPPGIHWALSHYQATLVALAGALSLLPQNLQVQCLAAAESSKTSPEGSLLTSIEEGLWESLKQMRSKREGGPGQSGSEAAGGVLAAALLRATNDLQEALVAALPGRLLGLRCAAASIFVGSCSVAVLDTLRAACQNPKNIDFKALRETFKWKPTSLVAVLRTLAQDEVARPSTLAVVAETMKDSTLSGPIVRALVAIIADHEATALVLTTATKVQLVQHVLAFVEDVEKLPLIRKETKIPDSLPKTLEEVRIVAALRESVFDEVAYLVQRPLQSDSEPPRRNSALQSIKHPGVAALGLRFAYQCTGLAGLAELFLLPKEELAWLQIDTTNQVRKQVQEARSSAAIVDTFDILMGKSYHEQRKKLGKTDVEKPKDGFSKEDSVLTTTGLTAVFAYGLKLDTEQKGRLGEEAAPPGYEAARKFLALPSFWTGQYPGKAPPGEEDTFDEGGTLAISAQASDLALLAPSCLQAQLRWMRALPGAGPYGCRGDGASRRRPNPEMSKDPVAVHGLFSLTFRLVGVAGRRQNSYLGKAFASPAQMKSFFLPAMAWDETQAIFEAMRAERVTWYRCPNGHLYSIGECGGPVQSTKCTHPGCNRTIGGVDHRPAQGNSRLGTFYEMEADKRSSTPGYNQCLEPHQFSQYNHQLSRGRLSTMSTESVCFQRLILHLAMLAGAETRRSLDLDTVGRLTSAEIWSRVQKDFLALKNALEWNSVEVVLALHIALIKLDSLLERNNGVSDSPDKAAHFETLVHEEIVRPTFLGTFSRKEVAAKLKDHQTSTLEALLKKQLGTERWEQITLDAAEAKEWDLAEVPDSDALWLLRPRASVDSLKQCFERRGGECQRLPLLQAFLQQEERLPLIGLMADVLAWQKLVTKVLGAEPITREEAAKRTNQDILDALPKEEKAAGVEVLKKFCTAFNQVMPKLTNLFECQKNPFLTDDGRVDLSGTAGGRGDKAPANVMGTTTPLHFTLPSHPPGPLADAPGLCTIQILNYLVRSHNEVCQQLMEVSRSIALRTSDEASESQNAGVAIAAVGTSAANAEEEAALALGAETPHDIIRQRLLTYSREQDFLPLLHEFSTGASQWGSAQGTDYDMYGLEAAIASRMLVGKRPLALQIRHYLYAGEARSRGTLAALQGVLPQVALLPGSLAEAVRQTLDTREQVIRFLGLLEEAMRFLVAVGTGPTKTNGEVGGKQLLSTYLQDVAMVDAQRLEAGLPSLIAQQAALDHLRALFLAAEAKLSGDSSAGSAEEHQLLPSVVATYRSALSKETAAMMSTACDKCPELASIMPVLRDLLTGALSDQSASFPGSESLREFLVYEDSDLERETWFVQHFPPDLRLEHALETFRLLVSRFSEQG